MKLWGTKTKQMIFRMNATSLPRPPKSPSLSFYFGPEGFMKMNSSGGQTVALLVACALQCRVHTYSLGCHQRDSAPRREGANPSSRMKKHSVSAASSRSAYTRGRFPLLSHGFWWLVAFSNHLWHKSYAKDSIHPFWAVFSPRTFFVPAVSLLASSPSPSPSQLQEQPPNGIFYFHFWWKQIKSNQQKHIWTLSLKDYKKNTPKSVGDPVFKSRLGWFPSEILQGLFYIWKHRLTYFKRDSCWRHRSVLGNVGPLHRCSSRHILEQGKRKL